MFVCHLFYSCFKSVTSILAAAFANTVCFEVKPYGRFRSVKPGLKGSRPGLQAYGYPSLWTTTWGLTPKFVGILKGVLFACEDKNKGNSFPQWQFCEQ